MQFTSKKVRFTSFTAISCGKWPILQIYVLTILLLYIAIKVLHRVYREKTDELSLRELVMLLTPAWSLLAVKPIMSSYLSLWLEGMKNGTIDRNVPGNPFRLIFCILSFFTIVILVTFYEYKEYIYGILDKLPYHPSQMRDIQFIDITEKGWEQMKEV